MILRSLETAVPATTDLMDAPGWADERARIAAACGLDVAGLARREAAAALDAIDAAWPELAGPEDLFVTVLCAAGPAAAVGYGLAAALAARGTAVEVLALGDPQRLPPDVRPARAAFEATGRRLTDLGSGRRLDLDDYDEPSASLLIDALSSGVMRPAPGADDLYHHHAPGAERIVALDLRCSLSPDRAYAGGHGIPADMTIALQRLRPGHVLGAGPRQSGQIVVIDADPLTAPPRPGDPVRLPVARLVAAEPFVPQRRDSARVPALTKPRYQHKYDHGHLLVLSGDAGTAGAARLAARAGLRVGAGLVTLGLPSWDAAGPGPDAIMRRVIDGADALHKLLDDPRLAAVCLGPGLGLDQARYLCMALLDHPRMGQGERPLAAVLDADALTAFAGAPDELLARTRGKSVVLTPHQGEFARLFPPRRSMDVHGRLEQAHDAALRAGCVVALKGTPTVVAAAGFSPVPCIVPTDDAPWLATAGSGDVLAGIIAGLLARGFPPLDAAATGAWLHAAAARRFGPGLIADDLPDQLPGVFRDLGL